MKNSLLAGSCVLKVRKKIMKTKILLMFIVAALVTVVHAAEEKTVKDTTVNLLFVQDAQGVEFKKIP